MGAVGGARQDPASALGVLVLGMHRSGTSAVAGMFARAGFFPGREDELMPPGEDNPAGYYENWQVYRANELVLEKLGRSWFDPPAREAQLAAQTSLLPILRAPLEDLIDGADGAPVVLKDPRISVMLPLWEQALAGRLHPVLVVRDPIEIARSLLLRDGTPPPFGLAAWEVHMSALLEHLDGREVTVAPYAALMSDPSLAPQLVATAAARLDPGRSRRVDTVQPADAIRPTLRHNEAADVDHDEQLTRHQQELWDFLASLPHGDARLEAPVRLRSASSSAWSVLRAETDRVAVHAAQQSLKELLRQAERSMAELQRLEQELRTELQQVRAELQSTRDRERELQAQYLTVVNSLRWRIMDRPARLVAAWRSWRERR